MQQLSNFEAAANDKISNSLTTDNLSNNLFNFIRDEFNKSRPDSGSSLVQNDVPLAFRGGSDLEIVDDAAGQSLTKKGNSVYKELESAPAKTRKDGVPRAIDEMPSSGKPPGTVGESLGRIASGDQRGSAANTRQHGGAQEAPSRSGRAGTKAESQMGQPNTDRRSSEVDNRKEAVIDEMPSNGKPAGATGEGKVGGASHGDHRSSEMSNKRNDVTEEAPSSGKPVGAVPETRLQSKDSADHRSSEENNRKNDTTDEVPSSGKPQGAVPESKLKGQDPNHKASDADPAQWNTGVEVESRRNNDGKPETLGEYGYM